MAADQEREFCRQAATLIRDARAGSLATVAGGAPYAALVTPAVADDAHLILLLSTLSAHTRHLMANPACALLLVGEPAETNPQTAPRVSLSCLAAVSDQAADRAAYLAHHPYAALYADFTDFNFWRLAPTAAHYVGGFAAASALDVSALQHEIREAAPAKDG
jgi:putative heme iron utilization protein